MHSFYGLFTPLLSGWAVVWFPLAVVIVIVVCVIRNAS